MPYKTAEQAYAVARSMGCNKIHKMPDGSYMPCGSHAEYNRMKKDGRNTKSHAISLAVENALRRKMRSHNNRYGQDKKSRATLGTLKRIYSDGLKSYKENRAQTREKWAYGKVNGYLNALAKEVEKANGDVSSTPAPPKDRRSGSSRNKPGSASGSRGGIIVTEATETTLRNKLDAHNKKSDKSWQKATMGKLKAVYRRGAGAFSTSHRPGMTRGQWAFARVNAFLHLLSTGKPKNSKYITDNDLLPSGHPALGKSESVDKAKSFRPPQSVADAAKRALEVRAKKPPSQRGMTLVGLARARDLSNRKGLSLDTVKRMKAYFDRHEVDKKGSTWSEQGKGWQAWNGWGGDAGRSWANKILRMEARTTKKMNNVFKLKDLCEGMYPVWVANDLYDKVEVTTWPELAMTLKKAEDYSWIYDGDGEEICHLDRKPRTVLKVEDRKSHSMLPGKHKYTLVDVNGKIVETGWLDDEFKVADHVTSEDQDPTESAKIITLTDEDRELDSIAETIADGVTTKEFFETIVDNKVEKGASLVFLSLMPTLDEMSAGKCLCGSIEKNLGEQIIDPVEAHLDQVSFVNIVPFEVTDETGKRSTPEKDLIDEWRPLVDMAISKADPNAIVVALGKDVASHYSDVVDFVMPHPFSKSKYSLPRKVEELKKAYEKKFDRQVKITKSDADRRLVYGVVLEPEVIDAHNDVVSVDEIENAAHNYLIKSRMIGDQHSKPAKADIVESYIAPADLDIGGQQIKKGSWVMVTKVHDDRMWQGIKKGSYTGYSIGGYAVKEPIEDVGLLAQ